MDKKLKNSINPLVKAIGKYPKDFTKKDIIDYVLDNEIKIINFRYVANDHRLKTLNFPVTNLDYLDTILTYGERVDGSSLFPYIAADSSDLYVVPRFSTAYLDPFAEIPTLGILCSFFTKDGHPLESSPEYILRKAHKEFKLQTGLDFHAMGELEFYVIGDREELFNTPDQKGYHESTPYSKFEFFRTEAMYLIAQAGGEIKYAHSEVGNFTINNKIYEQNEIEFLTTSVVEAADQLVIAQWILRTLAHRYGLDLSFEPKIAEGKAGSGLHFHTKLLKGDESIMIKDGVLSNEARCAIAGYMKCAASLTAFGNCEPNSYFRLVPHQEAPTTICWGDRNRSVLVRVPLGWTGNTNMLAIANPIEADNKFEMPDKQTVELRSADGTADIYLTLAALVTAARIGFEMEDPLLVAEKCYVNVNIHNKENEDLLNSLEQLPTNCAESAKALDAARGYYEAKGVFPKELIDATIKKLSSY